MKVSRYEIAVKTYLDLSEKEIDFLITHCAGHYDARVRGLCRVMGDLLPTAKRVLINGGGAIAYTVDDLQLMVKGLEPDGGDWPHDPAEPSLYSQLVQAIRDNISRAADANGHPCVLGGE